MNLSAIYFIENTINDKIYIGSATNLIKRWNMHKHQLRNNKHHSILLQRAWNKYGEEVFEFGILETVDKDNLINREQYFLDLIKPFDPLIGYNICPIAGSSLGVKQSEQTRKKISMTQKGRPNGLLGYKHRDDSKLKMSLKRRGENHNLAKLTWEIVKAIRDRAKTEKPHRVNWSKEYGVSPTTIGRILSNKIWIE
jgi:group I intron endonuclease